MKTKHVRDEMRDVMRGVPVVSSASGLRVLLVLFRARRGTVASEPSTVRLLVHEFHIEFVYKDVRSATPSVSSSG